MPLAYTAMPGHLAELAAIATGTVLMIVAQLAAVCSMTILSVRRNARQQRHRWLREVSPSPTSLVSSRSSGLVQRLHQRRARGHSDSETLNQLYLVSGVKRGVWA